MPPRQFAVREARAQEHAAIGRLLVSAYSTLDGFPGPDEQPAYYELLADVVRLATQPHTTLVVAIDGRAIVGAVVYISDMAQYGAGGSAARESSASGFRLLAVAPDSRGCGVGRALAEACIGRARSHRHTCVVIHTTAAMAVAWAMYERMGSWRSPDLDFLEGTLPVFGFRLPLQASSVAF